MPSALTCSGVLPKASASACAKTFARSMSWCRPSGVERLAECDEVAGDEPGSLMNQLVEGMLAVGSRLAPVNRAGIVVDVGPIDGHMFAVALHRQLLQIGRKPFQVLFVRQDGYGLRSKKIAVPHRQQSHQYRQVALKGGGAEVLVHLVEPIKHGMEVFRSDGQHRRETDGRVHGIASADPVPEAEHIGSVDAELDILGIGRDSDKCRATALIIAAQPLSGQSRAVGVGHRLQSRESL